MDTYGTEIVSMLVKEPDYGSDWPHFEWSITLTRDEKQHTFAYRAGIGHVMAKCGAEVRTTFGRGPRFGCEHVRCREKGPVPKPPTLYDALTALKADTTNDETFRDWCLNYGYEDDSRKALEMYLACQQSEQAARSFFGDDWPRIMADTEYE